VEATFCLAILTINSVLPLIFQLHFATLYSSSMDNGHQTVFETKLADNLLKVGCSAFTVLDVINAVKKMKLGNSEVFVNYNDN